MAKLETMRGLRNFISEIRACTGKDQETARVSEELVKIRKKFSGSSNMSEYDTKKYVWKLLYIYMLGYPVNFGRKEASHLIAAGRYAEKQVGYMACSILLSENDGFLTMMINSIKNDITCRNEAFQCLALNFIGSVGGPEMSAALIGDVKALLINGSVRPIVRKKAALALLRLLRKSPDSAEDVLPHDVWSSHIASLLAEQEIGVLLGATSLMLGIAKTSCIGYEGCVPKLVTLLQRLRSREVGPDYTYYGIASPWLQVKVLHLLQYCPPPQDQTVAKSLNEILKKLVKDSEPVKNLNKNNAQQAIVLEAAALALAIDCSPDVVQAATTLLVKYIGMREPNVKYLGLQALMRLVHVPAVANILARHQRTIFGALKEADVSVRRRAADLLFAMASADNAVAIVEEILTYLTIADVSMRAEIVLKTAVLAEKFFPDLRWYVATMVTLIERAGEYATEDVWRSTVQLVHNHEELRQYGARETVEALKRGTNHDAMVALASAIVGEYGQLVSEETSNEDQFEMLSQLYLSASSEGRGQLLEALALIMKRPNLSAASKEHMETVTDRHRAVAPQGGAAGEGGARRAVLPLPHWDKRKPMLHRRMADREGSLPNSEAAVKAAPSPEKAPEDTPPPEEEEEAVEEEKVGNSSAPDPDDTQETPKQERKRLQEEDLLGMGTDEGQLFNGYSQPTNPLDQLLSGMAIVPAGDQHAGGQPPQYQQQQWRPQQQQQQQQQSYGGYLQQQPPALAADPFAARGIEPSPQQQQQWRGPSELQIPAVLAARAAHSAGGSTPHSPVSQVGSPSPNGGAMSSYGGQQQVQVHQARQPPPQGPRQPQIMGHVGEWFRKLTVSESGVLYEDNYLQVGVKQGFQGASGQMQLFLGNKSADVTLTRVVCAVPPQPAFSVHVAPVPLQLEPLKQVTITATFTAVAPFCDPPRLQLGYCLPPAVGGGVSQSLALPAVVTKFLEPPLQPPPSQLFFNHWRTLSGPPHKVTNLVERETSLSRGAVAAIVSALRLADLQGFDPVAENVVATASFCFMPTGSAPQQVLVLVRIEVETQAHMKFQVTVASPDGQIAPAVLRLLCLHLAGSPSA